MEIRLEDLARRCTKCNGTGKVRDGSNGGHTGTPGFSVAYYEGDCPDCDRGYIITESGKAIRAFMDLIRSRP